MRPKQGDTCTLVAGREPKVQRESPPRCSSSEPPATEGKKVQNEPFGGGGQEDVERGMMRKTLDFWITDIGGAYAFSIQPRRQIGRRKNRRQGGGCAKRASTFPIASA